MSSINCLIVILLSLMLCLSVQAQNDSACITNWYPVLRYGQPLKSAYSALQGPHQRWLVTIQYRKGLFLFISRERGDPLAFEEMPDGSRAWHGECILKLSEYYP